MVAEVVSQHGGDLFADRLVASYVDDGAFISRHWLNEQVETAVADEDCRLVLLEAEPGAGKTAMLASLARAHPNWLRFFLRQDSRLPWESGDARSFLLTVGHQLAAQQPALFRSRQLEVSVEQIVERVHPGGRVAGISVRDLTVSPFYRTALRIQQRVSLLEGNLEGLSVDRLTVEERLLDVANLQFLALLAPAEALQEIRPRERLVVLVDALDEITRTSAVDGLNVVTWLATCPELPSNLRFVLASRPHREIAEPLLGRYGQQLRLLRIDPRSEQVQNDLTHYVHRFVDQPHVAAALTLHGLTPQGFARQAVEKADGNFQYLAALFAALEHAVEQQDDEFISPYLRLDQLPKTLGELYAYLLNQIRRAVRDLTMDRPGAGLYDPPVRQPAWQGMYQPILGVLTVAGQPLLEQQIARFVGVPANDRWFTEAVEALTPLLRRRADGIALYHLSLSEFLSANRTRVEYPQLYVDPPEWHRAIVRSYRAAADRWDDVPWGDVDDYGLLTLARHLRALANGDAESPYASELDALLCAPFMREKRRRFNSDRPFAENVRLSIGLASTGTSANGAVLVREVRGRYLLALLDTLASAVPLALIEVLARLGETGRALALADMRTDRVGRARAYLVAGAALVTMDTPDGRVLIEQALDMLTPPRNGGVSMPTDSLIDRLAVAASAGGPASHELSAAMAALCGRTDSRQTNSEVSQQGLTERVYRFIEGLPTTTQEVIHAREAAARPTAKLDELVAAAHLAVRTLVGADHSSAERLDELSALAGLLAEARDRDRLSDALELALSLYDGWYGTHASTWAAFATACATLDERDALARLLAAATREPDNHFRATALHGLAHAWGMVGDESGIAAVMQATSRLDPAFVSPAAVLAEVSLGALDGGHHDLACRCALEVIEQLQRRPDDAEMHVRVLHDIATALIDVGQKDVASAICHEAVPLTAGFVEMSGSSLGLGFNGRGDRAIALADLAEELGRCGDADGAWNVGLGALEAASSSLEKRQWCREVGLRFARGMIAAGALHRVREVIRCTEQACGDAWVAQVVTAQLGLAIAPSLHAVGERHEASNLVEWACRVAATLKDARHSEEAEDLCGKIVITLDDIDQPRKALLTLDTIQDPFIRASYLLSMAERRADKGNLDEGVRLAQRSLEELDTMDRAIDRIDTQAAAAHAFARCGDVPKARNLVGKALEGLENLDRQWHARPLGDIAAAAVLTDDRATGNRAFALARNDLMESADPRALVEVARQIARTGRLTELERIINTDEVLADSKLRQDLSGPVMRAYLDANHLGHALRIWRGLLGDDQLARLADLTRTLNRGVHVLAALDHGHTLIALHQALSEIRGWWPSSWSATSTEPQHSEPV